MAYTWGLLDTYDTWDDPPSTCPDGGVVNFLVKSIKIEESFGKVFDCLLITYPDLPVPYIFGTKLPVANISGN